MHLRHQWSSSSSLLPPLSEPGEPPLAYGLSTRPHSASEPLKPCLPALCFTQNPDTRFAPNIFNVVWFSSYRLLGVERGMIYQVDSWIDGLGMMKKCYERSTFAVVAQSAAVEQATEWWNHTILCAGNRNQRLESRLVAQCHQTQYVWDPGIGTSRQQFWPHSSCRTSAVCQRGVWQQLWHWFPGSYQRLSGAHRTILTAWILAVRIFAFLNCQHNSSLICCGWQSLCCFHPYFS